MGTKILGVIAFVAIAAAAGWNYQQNTNEVQLSEFQSTYLYKVRLHYK